MQSPRLCKAPLSTVYVIVDDLVEKNMLTRNGDGTIWLGSRLYHYGLAYARSLDFMSVATHEMHDLCRQAGETVQVCGRDGDYMLVLAMADGPSHFQVASRVGTRVPLNWTASGRLLVGHLPEEERIELFKRCAKSSPTGRAEMDPGVLSASAGAAFRVSPVDPGRRVRLCGRLHRFADLRQRWPMRRDHFDCPSRTEGLFRREPLYRARANIGRTHRKDHGLAQPLGFPLFNHARR